MSNLSEYINKTAYEASLKQRLAKLIGREFENLSGLSVSDLLHEVRVQNKEYTTIGCGKYMEPACEDAHMFINTGFPFN